MQILYENDRLCNAKNYYLQEYFYKVMYGANLYRIQEVRIVTKVFELLLASICFLVDRRYRSGTPSVRLFSVILLFYSHR